MKNPNAEQIMEGTLAHLDGDTTGETNPYMGDPLKYNAWMFGWRMAADHVQVAVHPYVC